ncbi:MAG: hypothetical protein U0174_08200 [Polyangiaceae bacterium]
MTHSKSPAPVSVRKKLKVEAKNDDLRAGGRFVTQVIVCGDKTAKKG